MSLAAKSISKALTKALTERGQRPVLCDRPLEFSVVPHYSISGPRGTDEESSGLSV